jgi:hypothetical protein
MTGEEAAVELGKAFGGAFRSSLEKHSPVEESAKRVAQRAAQVVLDLKKERTAVGMMMVVVRALSETENEAHTDGVSAGSLAAADAFQAIFTAAAANPELAAVQSLDPATITRLMVGTAK